VTGYLAAKTTHSNYNAAVFRFCFIFPQKRRFVWKKVVFIAALLPFQGLNRKKESDTALFAIYFSRINL
jgi:hypothetical protein